MNAHLPSATARVAVTLALLVALASTAAAAPAADDQGIRTVQALGVSAPLVVDAPLAASAEIPGFVHAHGAQVDWQFEAEDLRSVHRAADTPNHTVLVVQTPLVMGRGDTFIFVPDAVMTYEQVLRFVAEIKRPR
jgi:hypothetical protein